MTSTRWLLLVVLSLGALGCAKSQVGEACTASEACETGLSCIQNGGYSIVSGDLTCDAEDRLCSITCTTDSDCETLGAGHICVDDCFGGSCLVGRRD